MSEETTEYRKPQNLAVLIDADNVPHGKIKGIMDEITKNGIPTIRRIYGDWTKPSMSGWKSSLLQHSITPIQQYAYTTGKNATDSALIIDAMDILHRENVDGFCIVSSDSDFTRLASRLRESGKTVIGFGEKKTPKPFISSCNKFLYIEILSKGNVAAESAAEPSEPVKTAGTSKAKGKSKAVPKSSAPATPATHPASVAKTSLLSVDDELKALLKDVIDNASDDTGWANLNDVGNQLILRKSDFDPRNYGFAKLSLFFKSYSSLFEVEERPGKTKRMKTIYIKNKP